MFMVGIFMVSSLALMTPWLQVLSNYPVETAGLIMAPRGFGSLVTTIMTGREAPAYHHRHDPSEFRANYKWFYLSTILDDFSRCMIA